MLDDSFIELKMWQVQCYIYLFQLLNCSEKKRTADLEGMEKPSKHEEYYETSETES